MKNRRDLRGHLVRSDLVRMRKIRAGELRAAENGRQGMCRRRDVVRGNVESWIRELCRRCQCDQNESDTTEKTLHALIITLDRKQSKRGWNDYRWP